MANPYFMFFTVLSTEAPDSSLVCPKAYLIRDNWDDFGFVTQFSLIIFDEEGTKHLPGEIKIGQFGMQKQQRSPQVPGEFDSLNTNFFSLGQDDSYYSTLKNLSSLLKNKVLDGLRDVVADPSLFEQAIKEKVTTTSLLRFVTHVSVRGQFRRLLEGGARLSRYEFSYIVPSDSDTTIELHFGVKPESKPPTNIHVLIGRNGVGKTRLLNLMTHRLLNEEGSPEQLGCFVEPGKNNNPDLFANIVSVSFSAFDDFEPLRNKKNYHYIGLKRLSDKGEENSIVLQTPTMLATEFVKSLSIVRSQSAKATHWKKYLETLEADPIFKEAEVASLADDIANEIFKERARMLFNKLSSGHKIVLLTMTRLVETVEERTLVLLDEPEAHLHPPLLSAFVRALSDLLIYRNGVAIVATHSPVILQEVPRSCVWKLRRAGTESIAERPERETFGENVGVLTREVFGLEVTQSGFHRLLQAAVKRGRSFESTLKIFDNQLGAEARAILRVLIMLRDSEEES